MSTADELIDGFQHTKTIEVDGTPQGGPVDQLQKSRSTGPALNSRFLIGWGSVGSLAARTSVSAKVLVVAPRILSRPGAALLNVGTSSSESPETRHCRQA